MEYQSVHAPFGKARDFWYGSNDAAQAALNELIHCLEAYAQVQAPIMVAHVFIGFEYHAPNQRGLDYYEKVIRPAASMGVKIAFEDTEGMEYLDAVMQIDSAYHSDYETNAIRFKSCMLQPVVSSPEGLQVVAFHRWGLHCNPKPTSSNLQ